MASALANCDADVIVIGSGFGGAISADILSARGHRVLVLERGPRRDTVPVRSMQIDDRAPLPLGRHVLTHAIRNLRLGRFGLALNRAGLFELFSFEGLNVAVVSSVGGGSIAWGALVEPPADPDYYYPPLSEGGRRSRSRHLLPYTGCPRGGYHHALTTAI